MGQCRGLFGAGLMVMGVLVLALGGACSPPPPALEAQDVPPAGGGTDVGTASPPPPASRHWPEAQGVLEHYRIDFPPSTAEIVYDMARGREYAPGTFTARGVTYPVELRQRGDGARYHPKHSWKVKLPTDVTLDGVRRLNFLAEYLDAGQMTDVFSYRLMRAAGVPTPRVRLVELTVNGEYQGIYTLLEEVDKHFLRANGLNQDATIYRCGERDCEFKINPPAHYQAPWQKETNETEPFTELEQFLWALSRTPEHELEAFLAQRLELDAFLRYMAVNALIGNVGIDDSGSFFTLDHTRDKWLYTPWDLNNARIQFWRNDTLRDDGSLVPSDRIVGPLPAFTSYDPNTVGTWRWKQGKYGGAHRPFSVLKQRVWDLPALRNRVLDHIEELLAGPFSPQEADAQISWYHGLIAQRLPHDPWVNQKTAFAAPAWLKEYVRRRGEYVREQLPLERKRGEGGVVINAIGAPGVRVDELGEPSGFIELYNREDRDVVLEGKSFTNVLRKELNHLLPAGLVVPARGKLILWADGQVEQGPAHLPFTLSPTGGELGLFDGVNMWGVLDLTFYAPLAKGAVYRRLPDGAEHWGWSAQ